MIINITSKIKTTAVSSYSTRSILYLDLTQLNINKHQVIILGQPANIREIHYIGYITVLVLSTI
jgi:hypothetical protein